MHYARHRLGWATHSPVDYPRVAPPHKTPDTVTILWVIVTHQSPDQVAQTLARWIGLGFALENLLIAYGGIQKDFDDLAHPHKIFISDTRLRTVRHPVEKQSYTGILREVSLWMKTQSWSHISLVEYDHIPLDPHWGDHLLQRMTEEEADVLFHHLERVDGTNAPHYLYHLSDPRFAASWEPHSLREDHRVVCNALATGSFWTREAFDSVSAQTESTPIYLEMYLPSTAHHLGFRVRDQGDQNRFIHFDPHSEAFRRSAASSGAWSIHPVKQEG